MTESSDYMKRIKRKHLFLIGSFLIPIIILIVNFVILQGIYKNQNVFSSNQILVADLKSQYISLFNYLKNLFNGKESLFYSFSNTLGNNMIGTFAYYLSSPLNIILIFSSTHNLTNFICILIFLKIGLCGLTMYIYLNHKHRNKHFFSLIFSMNYALMAYNVSYYFNIMWLDVVYLAPLVLYGIDKLIHKKDPKLYLVFLSLAIISNFYIAYMLCIFCIIYFIYEMIITYTIKDKKQIQQNIKKFIIYSCLSGLICSFILIPTIIDLHNIIRSPISDSMYIQKNNYTNFLMSLSKLYMLPQNPENVLSKFTPNVYFGILPLLFSIIFFYGKSSNKEKYISIIIIVFFFLSFSTNIFNLFWHGLTYPNGYAYRFSFLFSLFMLIISYKAITNEDRLKIHKFLLLIFIIGFIGIVQINDGSNICFSYKNVILTIVLIIVYYIIISIIYKKNNIICKVILFIVVTVELTIHVNNSFCISSNMDYETDYNYYIDNICTLSNHLNNDNYRFDSTLIFGALESYSCQDNRISGAITTNNKDVYKFLFNSGFGVTYSTVFNNDNTPVMYSLMGVDFYLNTHRENSIKKINYQYEKNSTEYFYLHENSYALPIGFVINDKYKLLYNGESTSNAFEYQNILLKSMSGLNEDVLKSYDIKKIDDENYEVNIDNDNDIYVFLSYKIPENDEFFAEITINDKLIYDIDSDNTGIFKIKNNFNNEFIKVQVSVNDDKYDNLDDILYFYYFDEDIFAKHINILKEKTLNITKKEKNYLKGNIEVDDDSVLFLSIPYEAGWNIYIDGKKIEYFKLYDTFIGLNLKKGKHVITMKFFSPGISEGIILSIIGVLISIIIYKKNNK